MPLFFKCDIVYSNISHTFFLQKGLLGIHYHSLLIWQDGRNLQKSGRNTQSSPQPRSARLCGTTTQSLVSGLLSSARLFCQSPKSTTRLRHGRIGGICYTKVVLHPVALLYVDFSRTYPFYINLLVIYWVSSLSVLDSRTHKVVVL